MNSPLSSCLGRFWRRTNANVSRWISLGLLSLGALSGAAQTNVIAPVASTNVILMDESIPRSVFLMPRKQEDGRDPFFPNSQRLFSVNPTGATNRVARPMPAALDLRLKGISGRSNRRLALINNHTFETGEEADVIAGERRIRIRCVLIGAESVVIEVGSERKELRLRSDL